MKKMILAATLLLSGVLGVADAHIVLNNFASAIGREEPNKVT